MIIKTDAFCKNGKYFGGVDLTLMRALLSAIHSTASDLNNFPGTR